MRTSSRSLSGLRHLLVSVKRSECVALRSWPAVAVFVASLLMASHPACAQQPQAPQPLDESGFVDAPSGAGLTAKLGKNPAPWVINVGPQTKVLVTGSAEPSYLHSGLSIKFTTELDKKGTAIPREIEQIEVFTASGKGSIGVYDSVNPDKPIRVPDDGKLYEVRTKVGSFKPESNELAVTINGKKVVAKTSANLAIKVESDDIGLAQEGDSIAVKGMQQQRPNPQQGQPGLVAAESVTVTLAKPLAGATKKKARTPMAKGLRGKAAAPEAPSDVPNPFAK